MEDINFYLKRNYKIKSITTQYSSFLHVELYFLIRNFSFKKIWEIEFRTKNNLIEIFFIETIFSQPNKIKWAWKEILLNFIKKYKNLGYKGIIIQEILPENTEFFTKSLKNINYFFKGKDIYIYFS